MLPSGIKLIYIHINWQIYELCTNQAPIDLYNMQMKVGLQHIYT